MTILCVIPHGLNSCLELIFLYFLHLTSICHGIKGWQLLIAYIIPCTIAPWKLPQSDSILVCFPVPNPKLATVMSYSSYTYIYYTCTNHWTVLSLFCRYQVTPYRKPTGLLTVSFAMYSSTSFTVISTTLIISPSSRRPYIFSQIQVANMWTLDIVILSDLLMFCSYVGPGVLHRKTNLIVLI